MNGVVGAAGTMGCGIAKLLARRGEELVLIDADLSSLRRAKKEIREDLRKHAERDINSVRTLYCDSPSLVSNADIIQTFVEERCDAITFSDTLHTLKKCKKIFEAIVEEEKAKISLLQECHAIAPDAALLTNTSSIPIGWLAKQAGVEGQLVGFHFYNPAHVQKLLELVVPEGVEKNPSLQLAKQMGKQVVEAGDVAGFIGNGLFLRELSFACELAEKQGAKTVEEATGEGLLRPMGIFTLAHFVGIKVCLAIAKIMCAHNNGLSLPLKNLAKHIEEIEPSTSQSWQERKGEAPIDPPLLTGLAGEFLEHSRAFAKELLESGAAKSGEDINIVCKLGFGHLYALCDSRI